MSSEASTLLGLLADDDRLRTVAALVLGRRPASASEVAAAAGLDLRRAAKALTRLAGAGLVDQHGDSYVLRPERFREALDSLGRPEAPADVDSGLGADADRVLRIFVHDGRLVQIKATQCNSVPLTSQPDHLIVLRLNSASEPEVVYDGPGREPWNQCGPRGKNGQRFNHYT